jgi:hypothetical protein
LGAFGQILRPQTRRTGFRRQGSNGVPASGPLDFQDLTAKGAATSAATLNRLAGWRTLMAYYRLSEDEAAALIPLGVDFGETQVADGNPGVQAIVRSRYTVRRRRRRYSSFFGSFDIRSRRSCMSFI